MFAKKNYPNEDKEFDFRERKQDESTYYQRQSAF